MSRPAPIDPQAALALQASLPGWSLSADGRAISRDEILSRVWRLDPSGINTRTIDMHIARLREKLRDDSTRPAIILTVRGKGYMLATAKGGE